MMVGVKDESLNAWLFGCDLYTLDKFQDDRGFGVPMLSVEEPCEQYAYYSVTYPGAARDTDRWHVHQHHTDRFIVLRGQVMFAISDGIHGNIVRITMYGAEIPSTDGRSRMLVVPPGIYHCLRNTGSKDALLINMPTRIYDPDDEGRISFEELGVESPW